MFVGKDFDEMSGAQTSFNRFHPKNEKEQFDASSRRSFKPISLTASLSNGTRAIYLST
jgi:hypothetical protein